MNTNILKIAHLFKIQHCICVLSTCIFPNNVQYPITEEMIHDGPPHDSNYAYAYAKRMVDIHCKIYREQYNRNYRCIIPTNIYGPNDNFSIKDGHAIASLIHKCFKAKQNNFPLCVYGDGTPVRQFIYSEDVARIILQIISTEYPHNIITTVNTEQTITEVVNTIMHEFDYHNVYYNNIPIDNGQLRKTASAEKLKEFWPEFKPTDFKTGVQKTVQWFLDHYPNIRC